jgi:hypothetical protein
VPLHSSSTAALALESARLLLVLVRFEILGMSPFGGF